MCYFAFPFDHDGFHQLPINENQAQKGTYYIIFLGASSSKGLIFPSSTASRIYRESAALFLSSAPNRFLSEALVKQSRITHFRQAWR